MDEPTSSLTLTETDRLLQVIADLKADGVSVIFISHRLNEVQTCADRVVVLRDGRAGRRARARARSAHDRMIRLMIGRDLKSLYLPPAAPPGASALEIVEARTATYPAHSVNLAVRRGEILGLAGLIGAGRTELARAVFGIDRLLGGGVRLDGEPVADRARRATPSPRGIYLVPEDRKARGPAARLLHRREHLAAATCRPTRAARWCSARRGARQRRGAAAPARHPRAERRRRRSARSRAATSRRWCWRSGCRCSRASIIFDEPTRGIDVGAKSEIYDMLRGLADAGVAILMISSDMEEVIGVSDRIAVMHEGAISGILERAGLHRAQGAAARRRQPAPLETRLTMQKKDLGLLVLILVVGAVVALINQPLFLSPINLANTANLVGLFGLFAIGQGFVIITGGIELSVGSVIALLGVLFVDLIVNHGVPWPLAALLMLALGVLIGLAHGLLITRMRMQPFIVTLCGLLIYRGVARFYTADATAGFAFGAASPTSNG